MADNENTNNDEVNDRGIHTGVTGPPSDGRGSMTGRHEIVVPAADVIVPVSDPAPEAVRDGRVDEDAETNEREAQAVADHGMVPKGETMEEARERKNKGAEPEDQGDEPQTEQVGPDREAKTRSLRKPGQQR